MARKGEVIDREPRPIRIDEIEMLEIAGTRLVFRVHCSKGTYIRSLVEDIAAKAGTVAHTARLHRETVGAFRSADMLDLTGLEAVAETGPEELRARLLPPDTALEAFPAVVVDDKGAAKFLSGQEILASQEAADGLVRVYGAAQEFLGVGTLADGSRLAPKRVFKASEKNS